MLGDRDTAEATYEVVRGLAGGLVPIFLAFTLYNVIEVQTPAIGLVITIDQVALAVSALIFWLMRRRKIPTDWAHSVAVSLGLLVAVDVSASVMLQGEGSDLRYMQAIVIGGGAIALSGRAFVVLLSGTTVVALPAALLVCSKDDLMDFAVMQTTTSLLSIALFYGRVPSQKRLLALRQRAARAAAEVGQALARAEHEFAEHQRSELKRQHLEEQLRQAQKLEALGTLAGGVAHDINNVLGAVTATASAAVVTHAQGMQVHQELADILSAARRGETLTRNILSFARRVPTQSAPFGIDDVVRGVEALLVRTLPKNVQLTAHCSAGELWVNGDAGQIGHALMNLCLNSADAIDGLGQIEISTRPAELHGEQPNQLGTTSGCDVEISVSDTGKGIPPEALSRVFEPYFSTKLHQGHSGLGLSMVYGTVQQHGGGIAIRSAVGQGTTVRVCLPAQVRLPDPPVSRCRHAPKIDSIRNCLLFVDDEPVLRRAGRRIGKSLGFEVLVASHGQEALEVYARHAARIGVVVLDVAMPVMNGEDCFRALRQVDPTLPIILASGFPEDHDIQKLLEDTRARYVPKPYEIDDLQEALAALL